VSGLASRVARDLRTARHIPPAQLAHRLRFLGLRALYSVRPELPIRTARRRAAGARARRQLPRVARMLLGGTTNFHARALAAIEGRFEHLGTTRDYGPVPDWLDPPIRWRDPDVSPLWAYQMQYLGTVVDFALCRRPEYAAVHLASWQRTFGDAWDPVAWHPYPVSLRLVNVCHAASVLGSFDALGEGAVELVATHARFLEDHLERDVRGNHLLENAVALVTAAAFVDGAADERAALRLLRDVVEEQFLGDGTHFELSPMYHAIVLHRLLLANAVVAFGPTSKRLREAIEKMTRRLAWMLCPDGDLPLFGDSARGFAFPISTLLDLGDLAVPGLSELDPTYLSQAPEGVSSAADAGLHVLRDGPLWCMIDAGAVCPQALPAHGQADALTVEVWIGDACLVTDPGLHEYTGEERAWGRSSRAHSTITVDDRDSSEVYGSFRVGGRETMESVVVDETSVTATLRPWGIDARMTRRVSLVGGAGLRLDDHATAPPGSVVRSRLHLHPDVAIRGGVGTDELTLRIGDRDIVVRASGPLSPEVGRCSRLLGEIRETEILVLVLERDEPGFARGWIEIRPGADA